MLAVVVSLGVVYFTLVFLINSIEDIEAIFHTKYRQSTLPICIYEKYSKEKLRIGYFCNLSPYIPRLFSLNKEEKRWVDQYGRYIMTDIENRLREYQNCSSNYGEIRQKTLADYYGIRRGKWHEEQEYLSWISTNPDIPYGNSLDHYIEWTIRLARRNGTVYKEPEQVKMPPKYPKF